MPLHCESRGTEFRSLGLSSKSFYPPTHVTHPSPAFWPVSMHHVSISVSMKGLQFPFLAPTLTLNSSRSNLALERAFYLE